MASSDDEAEAEIKSVSNYDFVDDDDEPISFSVLPVQWKKDELLGGKRKHIFLCGDADNGNMKIYEEVTAWKFDLSSPKPSLWVLHKKKSWILLEKPRKAYEDTIIRTIVVTLHCLHFFRKNPGASLKSLWELLHQVFSFEPKPSENDLVEHIDFISETLKHDELLAKSKVLVTFLKERPTKKRIVDEVKDKTLSGFIVDDLGDESYEGRSDDEEDDQFESVCAICDNGGEIICCEGKCLRSFHATEEAGSDVDPPCESLGLTHEQVEDIQKFYCKNCLYQKHQCFACGELGSSDLSSGAEVFRCINATCGRFYHPHCVAKLLNRSKKLNMDSLQKKIAAGELFACPMHQCFVCNQIEDKKNKDMQFAICRRCPRAYHRKCLPSEIVFEDDEEQDIDEQQNTVARAWENLIPNRILIYCLEHEIDVEIKTPVRNHLKFPGVNKHKVKQNTKMLEKKRIIRKSSGPLHETEDVSQNSVAKHSKGLHKPSTGSVGVLSKKREGKFPPPSISKKQKVMGTTKKSADKASSAKSQPGAAEGKMTLGQMLFELNQQRCSDAEPVDSNKVTRVSLAKEEPSSSSNLDADSEKRIQDLMKESSKLTLDEVLKMLKVPTEHAYSSKVAIDRSITLGKVDGSIKAIRTALQRLEEGGSVDDAKVVCDPAHLTQIIKWKNKLKVYLAPFLYGMRYTSFGRHFTQVDKLKEIVNMLQWYVQEGDTIVDFCCGSNDFSCLMKKKVDEIGKKCSFKNFDILQPKNDFCFEKRDWMTVQPKELPPGSKLIMGLNPPFGVNAGLANKFINKALEFKPKLLILIVPQETQRLDAKKNAYDLIWENEELLSGKAFYLPGSVDVNDKTLDDWNVSAPPLYLWSRRDWTSKHREIAEQHGHLLPTTKEDRNQSQKTTAAAPVPKKEDQNQSEKTTTTTTVPVPKKDQNQSEKTAAAAATTTVPSTTPTADDDSKPPSREVVVETEKAESTPPAPATATVEKVKNGPKPGSGKKQPDNFRGKGGALRNFKKQQGRRDSFVNPPPPAGAKAALPASPNPSPTTVSPGGKRQPPRGGINNNKNNNNNNTNLRGPTGKAAMPHRPSPNFSARKRAMQWRREGNNNNNKAGDMPNHPSANVSTRKRSMHWRREEENNNNSNSPRPSSSPGLAHMPPPKRHDRMPPSVEFDVVNKYLGDRWDSPPRGPPEYAPPPHHHAPPAHMYGHHDHLGRYGGGGPGFADQAHGFYNGPPPQGRMGWGQPERHDVSQSRVRTMDGFDTPQGPPPPPTSNSFNSLSFAQGPYRPAPHNDSGWLYE
ncbi:unnamed protein product [Cuscuta campestris]|uniref:Zinc finger PHD-type domain-containing protein n=1 Tax=Cuscuta campestris TaxID=132261 RepID=A0A484MS68_9ASTE|nr:unnamed protein product [Cuscuta campestris]